MCIYVMTNLKILHGNGLSVMVQYALACLNCYAIVYILSVIIWYIKGTVQ